MRMCVIVCGDGGGGYEKKHSHPTVEYIKVSTTYLLKTKKAIGIRF